MALAKIKSVTGTALAVSGNDIDTDRIIPARFMKCVTFDGLGEFAFYDERDFATQDGRVHAFDDPSRASASILLSGVNFGCGSSREHAPQSLYHWGIRGIVAGSFAEIFFGNSTTLGIPCLTASDEVRRELGKLISDDSSMRITLDIDSLEIRAGDQAFPASLPGSAQQTLVNGQWDSIAELLQAGEEISAMDQALSYVS